MNEIKRIKKNLNSEEAIVAAVMDEWIEILRLQYRFFKIVNKLSDQFGMTPLSRKRLEERKDNP